MFMREPAWSFVVGNTDEGYATECCYLLHAGQIADYLPATAAWIVGLSACRSSSYGARLSFVSSALLRVGYQGAVQARAGMGPLAARWPVGDYLRGGDDVQSRAVLLGDLGADPS